MVLRRDILFRLKYRERVSFLGCEARGLSPSILELTRKRVRLHLLENMTDLSPLPSSPHKCPQMSRLIS